MQSTFKLVYFVLLAVPPDLTNLGSTLKIALLSTRIMGGGTFSKIYRCSDPKINIYKVMIGKLLQRKKNSMQNVLSHFHTLSHAY